MLNIAKQIRNSSTRGQKQTYTMMDLEIIRETSETVNVADEPNREGTSME